MGLFKPSPITEQDKQGILASREGARRALAIAVEEQDGQTASELLTTVQRLDKVVAFVEATGRLPSRAERNEMFRHADEELASEAFDRAMAQRHAGEDDAVFLQRMAQETQGRIAEKAVRDEIDRVEGTLRTLTEEFLKTGGAMWFGMNMLEFLQKQHRRATDVEEKALADQASVDFNAWIASNPFRLTPEGTE